MFIIYLRLFTLAFYVFLFTLLRTAICLRANEISATDWLPLRIVASFGSHMAKLHQLCVLWSYLLLLACCQLPVASCQVRASELSLKLMKTADGTQIQLIN